MHDFPRARLLPTERTATRMRVQAIHFPRTTQQFALNNTPARSWRSCVQMHIVAHSLNKPTSHQNRYKLTPSLNGHWQQEGLSCFLHSWRPRVERIIGQLSSIDPDLCFPSCDCCSSLHPSSRCLALYHELSPKVKSNKIPP